ncbi:sensor domain-containing diguanylate cyclase [Pseudonocardia endophytica]|uniref:GGDEF domain-containing protein n=1 Tax=Pseudonocardia endophytica TaxID=401976 RepID=A0A4R1HWV7_PSEEN|nr:DICT sensory domain-containing protein [Pseudonocardia endophytica]TCK25973.1 GGDEF domain-containing protein [Pseudonocardia endophytica]
MLSASDVAHSGTPDQPPSRTVTSSSLTAVSRAIEEWALATPDDPPLMVVALFQRPPYFVRAAHVYARLARMSGVTVAAFAGDAPSSFPEGLVHVRLADDEPLVREWSVTVLGRRSGATVVAHDLERVDGSARSLERGRTFTARWSFRRTAAVAELRRLRAALGTRLPGDTAIDRALDADEPDSGADRRQEAAMAVVLDRLASQRRRADRALSELDDAVAGAERDPQSGLPTRAFLDRWTAGSASGTLPVGLALFRVHELSLVRARHGVLAEREVLEAVARVLRGYVVGADRVVRVGREEFLLVLPSRSTEQLARWTERARAEIGALSGAHPFVPTPASAVITRTRLRPLPLGPLWAALDRAVETGVPVTELGG